MPAGLVTTLTSSCQCTLHRRSKRRIGSLCVTTALPGCRYKHARIKEDPELRHTRPITSAMEVGWPRGWPLTAPAKGKVKCKETKIAEAQVLGPRYVDVLSPDTKMHF